MITDKLLKELKSNFDLCATEILHRILYGVQKTDKTVTVEFEEKVYLESMIGDFTTLISIRCNYSELHPDYYEAVLQDDNGTNWILPLFSLPENVIMEIIHATSNHFNSK